MLRAFCFSSLLAILPSTLWAVDGNLLSHLQDATNPYYVHAEFPKLTTPQWIGEVGVDAVVVLAIDDMRDTAKYEAYLRPLLDRLKKIDGRAPVSIMTNAVEPDDPRLQQWLAEGLSFDVHTIDHPCPCLQGGDFAKAKNTYQRCVDLLHKIPGNHPVAFRMPCCDSLNTPSPRFWTEIFNQQTPEGHFLSIDSSVFNIVTSQDVELPAEIFAAEPDRFRKYLPFPSFVNTIENYPYPYLIAGKCLEFPCVVPSDWEAQHIQQPNNPATVEDMAAALDAIVAKKGVFNLVFHPHGWIRAEQVAQLVDHATETHGTRVKFLTFQESLARIQRHVLGGRDLRGSSANFQVLLLDLNNDGFQDVFIRDGDVAITRIWDPVQQQWGENLQPWPYLDAKFELHVTDKAASVIVIPITGGFRRLHLRGDHWQDAPLVFDQADAWRSWLANPQELDAFALRDLDRNGTSELILGKGDESVIFSAGDGNATFRRLAWSLPSHVRLATSEGGDSGLRFVDVNGDGYDDCLFSNAERYSVHLFDSIESGWSQEIMAEERDQPGPIAIPMIVRSDGTNNGAWFHSNQLWVQNEDTSRLADNVDRVAFRDLAQFPPKPDPKYGGLPGPRSPEDSLRAIKTTPGFAVELVAAEPLIEDPVAFDWGPDGRLWVAEMRGYPNGMDGKGKPGGRIKVLYDDDEDGRYDRAATFLEDVSFPTGLKVWKQGVLVSAAPEIFYAADTNGDDQADERQVLYRGFTEGNQQHRVNGLRFGVDGWLYLANGDSGGEVESVMTGQKVRIRGRDLRIRPESGELEAVAGQTQFGRNQDDFGNWFGGNNSEPMWHYVLDDRLQARNAFYASPSPRKIVPQRPGPAPVFPASQTIERFNDFDRANRFTSACSPMVYRDQLLGDPQDTYSFVCEPVHNLVHRELLTTSGASFSSERLPEENASEFVASADTWCRPVMVRTGPDGGLWIADMYRLVIEHPEWIPAAWQAKLDVRSGDDRGRIYRVFDQRHGLRKFPRLHQLSTPDLVQTLDQPNGEVRDMAHQLLMLRQDEESRGPLSDLALGNSLHSAARIHALYLLHDLDALDSSKLARVIRDAPPEVSRHAVRLASQFISEGDEIGMSIQARSDTHPAWDLQAAYTLGDWNDPRAADVLGDILLRQAEDPYVVAAVMSSLTEANIAPMARHVHQQARTEKQLAALAGLLSQVVALGKGATGQVAFTLLFDEAQPRSEEWRWLTLAQLLARATHKNFSEFVGARQLTSLRLQLARARQVAEDDAASLSRRLAAVKLLGFEPTNRREELATLHGLVSPHAPLEVQLAALDRIEAIGEASSSAHFAQMFRECSPRVRSRVAALVASRDQWALDILRAMSANELRATWFDARQRQQLASHNNKEIKQLATALFSTATHTPRGELVARYLDIDPSAGRQERGQQVFAKSCATCHRWGDVGYHVGPDLAALSRRTPDALLTAILDPNSSLEAPYVDYAVFTEDGLRYSGIIAAETESAVTLMGPEGKQQTILRKDIDAIQSTNLSLMPEGLEKDLSRADLADLLALLGSRSESPKQFPGNSPQLAPVRDDGSIRLFAVHAEIYGPTLVFEDKYANLGDWQSIGDRAVWRLKPSKSGKYAVIMDYACADDAAGNAFRVSVGDQTLAGRVESTGGWDDYRRATLGAFELEDETEATLIFRSDGPIQGHLIDLRTIFLYPED